MTLLHEAVEAKKLDVRVVERNVTRGVVTQDEVKKAMDKLPDDADNAEYIAIDSLLNDGEGTPSSHSNGRAGGSLSH